VLSNSSRCCSFARLGIGVRKREKKKKGATKPLVVHDLLHLLSQRRERGKIAGGEKGKEGEKSSIRALSYSSVGIEKGEGKKGKTGGNHLPSLPEPFHPLSTWKKKKKSGGGKIGGKQQPFCSSFSIAARPDKNGREEKKKNHQRRGEDEGTSISSSIRLPLLTC